MHPSKLGFVASTVVALALGCTPPRGRSAQAGGVQIIERHATKICQVTGTEDRGSAGTPTGVERTGVSGGVNGTDLGFPFEYDGRLNFFFGDSREFDPDRCEPTWCGTEISPIPVSQPDPRRVQRWHTHEAWDSWSAIHGDGWDSMAWAPIEFDPAHCIPLAFHTERRQGVFAQEMVNNTVGVAFRLAGPIVGGRSEDRSVLAVGNRLLVITRDGRVFAHGLTKDAVGVPFQLGGWTPVASQPQDRWVLTMGTRILVITQDGKVFAHEITSSSVGAPFQLGGSTPVASQPRDKWVLAMGMRILVITQDGKVFAHDVANNTIGVPYALATAQAVAVHPQDQLVVTAGSRILVITYDGRVFAHDVTGNLVNVAFELGGSSAGAPPGNKWVVPVGNRLVVVSDQDSFRPTRFNGAPTARSEGVFGGFVDGSTIHAFFTARNRPPGCTSVEGCAHDDIQPGGKLVLATSLDGGGNYESRMLFSTTKFLFAAPAVDQASRIRGLPPDLKGSVVLVWGTGRENNDTSVNVARWNHSYPFLAVAPLASAGAKDGLVFVHDVTKNIVSAPVQLLAPLVAARPEDKRVLVMGTRLVVITRDGRVFAHDLSGSIGVASLLGGQLVASRPEDKWVLAMGNRLLVITQDGRVFAHDVVNNMIRAPYQLAGWPSVASQPGDKWVLAMGNRLLVITQDGRVFAHDVVANTIQAPFQLGAGVAIRPEDTRVLAMGSRIIVIARDGRVFAHDVVANALSAPYQLGAGVATRLEDKWVLAAGSRLLVITKQPWRYYQGIDAGTPIWTEEEARAAPVAPFGAPELGPGYHQCLGYFSTRYIDALSKWVMLYTCSNDASVGYNPQNGPRGVYFRSAPHPWGPWSKPQQVFDAGDGYCAFMHDQAADAPGATVCNAKGTNPDEESVRDTLSRGADGSTKRAWAGEYAPFLLPSRYASVGPDKTSLYFLMSTWNPYQVVLMNAQVAVAP